MHRLVLLVVDDVMRIVHFQRSGLILGISDFVVDEGFDRVKVEDGLSSRVEGEPSHLASLLPFSGAVGVILGSTCHKVNDGVPFEFVFELSQASTSR